MVCQCVGVKIRDKDRRGWSVKRRKDRRWVAHQQEDAHQQTKLDGKVVSRTSTGMSNTMMWLTASGHVGFERRAWRDWVCEIVLTRCRLIDKRSHSRERTRCTTMWRPNLGWSRKTSPILAPGSNLTAMVERCPCEETRSPRLSSGTRDSCFLSC
jgi:hypothetical protein